MSVHKTITTFMLLSAMSISLAEVFTPQPSDDVLDNPHRGFMLWGSSVLADGGLPDNHHGANIYHVYLPWRMIETADQVFAWSQIEQTYINPILNTLPESTLVLRIVADYPDGPGSGMNAHYTGGDDDRDYPIFLEQPPLNIARNAYTSCNGDGPGIAPDWNNPAFQTQATELVSAFGAHFDGDPRITAVQVGLLGLWGEWHQSGCADIAPNNAIKNAMKLAYNNAFTLTPLQTRYAREPDVSNVNFGFHEDYFPSFTGPCIYDLPQCDDSGDWNLEYGFANRVPAARNNWQVSPISGESPLHSQQNAWLTDEADVTTLINDYHFSFLGPAGQHENSGQVAAMQRLANQLGYRFQVNHLSINNPITSNSSLVQVSLSNVGSAPIYFKYQLAIDWVDAANNTLLTWEFADDLSQLLAAESNTLQHTFNHQLAAGEYSLRLYLKPGHPTARTIVLANQHHDATGRLIIGPITINLSDLIFADDFE